MIESLQQKVLVIVSKIHVRKAKLHRNRIEFVRLRYRVRDSDFDRGAFFHYERLTTRLAKLKLKWFTSNFQQNHKNWTKDGGQNENQILNKFCKYSHLENMTQEEQKES